MKPIIAIAANISSRPLEELHKTAINYIPTQFAKAIEEAGGLPLIIPVVSTDNIDTYLDLVDGLILVGGYDISPQFYAEEPLPQLQETHPLRDMFELALVKAAFKKNIPIFGVCRGMQIINVAFGGSLYQDIESQTQVPINHLQNTNPAFPYHQVETEKDSFIQKAIGDKVLVNTLHHQAIKELGTGLQATTYSSDQVVETIESQRADSFVLGVQWHPEILLESNDTPSKAIFKAFVKECAAFKTKK